MQNAATECDSFQFLVLMNYVEYKEQRLQIISSKMPLNI
jgi:hypothetical protein